MREGTSAHIFCECEALASLRHAYLGSFLLEPEDIKSLAWGPSGTIVRLRGSHDSIWGTKGPSNQGLNCYICSCHRWRTIAYWKLSPM